MSARAPRTCRTDRTQVNLDDDRQQALLGQARAGSVAAHEVLFTSQRAWLEPWFERRWPKRLQCKLDADDLVQDAWLRAEAGLVQFNGQSIAQYRGWLVVIAKHDLANALEHYLTARCRGATREEPLDERAIDRGEQRPRNAEHFFSNDLVMVIEIEAFEVWLAALSDRQRRIYLWHERDGRSSADIAHELGCCPRSVRRACLTMREAFARHLRQETPR